MWSFMRIWWINKSYVLRGLRKYVVVQGSSMSSFKTFIKPSCVIHRNTNNKNDNRRSKQNAPTVKYWGPTEGHGIAKNGNTLRSLFPIPNFYCHLGYHWQTRENWVNDKRVPKIICAFFFTVYSSHCWRRRSL